MADLLNENGLTLSTYTELLDNIQSAMNTIYAQDGDTINFDSETPDGQFTNILTQIGADVRQLAMEVYNSFNPDNCTGIVQDWRYAINFITRKGGTYTIQNIDITTDRTVTLQGLDGNFNQPTATAYTVSDDSGNQWYLIDTTTLTAGTTSLAFRSQNLGLVQTTIGTIQNQVTKVLGVTNVNNTVAPTSRGVDEESDLDFRIRRTRSTAIKGQNNYDIMNGQLLELENVVDAKVFVNNTNSTNTDVTGNSKNGVPPYNIWVIVEGGSNDDIANVIYHNSAGLPTFGYAQGSIKYTEVVTITVAGQTFRVKFNRVNPVPLHVRFDLKIAETGISINEDTIKNYIVDNLLFKLNQNAETSYITEVCAQALLQFNADIYALNVEISLDGSTWTDYLPSTSWMNKFVVDASRITITQV